MFRAFTIVATVAALAVSAAPIASAGTPKKPPPRTAQVVVLIGANDYGLVTPRPVTNPAQGAVMALHGDFAGFSN